MPDKLEKHVKVETYSGYKADEQPVRVTIDGQARDVAEVEDRWYSPGATFFRVRLANGERYVLRRMEAQEVLVVEAYRSSGLFTPD
jgi:predicted RNA-binding protein